MRLLLAAAVLAPSIAIAASGGNDSPPSKPATSCKGSQVYDDDKAKCVDPKNSSLDRDEIYLAVRQLAYAERYEDALGVLDVMEENDSGRLTYLGFINRKLGNFDEAMRYYNKAIEQDPANILARSYMGQGLVDAGKIDLALDQLQEIWAHGGSGTWSEQSLRTAIATGTTYNY